MPLVAVDAGWKAPRNLAVRVGTLLLLSCRAVGRLLLCVHGRRTTESPGDTYAYADCPSPVRVGQDARVRQTLSTLPKPALEPHNQLLRDVDKR